MAKKILLVGWSPQSKSVNFSKWPGLTPEILEKVLLADQAQLVEMGYDAEWAFLETPETAEDMVVTALQAKDYDVVLVGAGLRTSEENFMTFERLINAIHEYAPRAKIAFNTNPKDTAEAVQRWL
ncbi:hypothetical protein FVE85_3691 [Porphyridium purpureum]|uniref:Uncharacterized protein n=1 Tax=Porphyridium purpureum TaxID=35688 RepID=A0A5J4YNH0_PORPP|nr:hypothetical protein FVE85_3691 [Porphyridium purpureum]|eukprot:POR9629..scf249_10